MYVYIYMCLMFLTVQLGHLPLGFHPLYRHGSTRVLTFAQRAVWLHFQQQKKQQKPEGRALGVGSSCITAK